MLRRTLSRLSGHTRLKMVGGIAGGFAGGVAAHAYVQRAKVHPVSSLQIHKALEIDQEKVNAILAEEAASHDKVREEFKAMKVIHSEKEIDTKLQTMATDVVTKLKGEKNILVLTMLNGASYVASKLKQELYDKHNLLFKEDAIRIGRYGNSHQGGRPKIERMPAPDKVVGRKILIIEDLIEGGITIQCAIDELIKLGAKREDIFIAVLIDKVNMREKGYEHVKPDFSGFIMKENHWVVGYGLDQSGFGRAAKDLMCFPEEEQKKFGYR